jgi:hypothetical protein
MAEYSHNSARHSSTGKSPFSLILGYEPHSYPPIGKTFLLALESRLLELEEARKEALAAHEKAQRTMRERISFKFRPWRTGNKVWLEGRNLRLCYPSRKLAPRQKGLFEVAQVISPVAFCLRLPPTWKIHDVFHASLLSSYKETTEHSPNYSNPPGDLIGGEEEFELDRILSHRWAGGRRQYLVSWKGYSAAENTWEPEGNLKHTQTILRAYKLRHPSEFPNPCLSQ